MTSCELLLKGDVFFPAIDACHVVIHVSTDVTMRISTTLSSVLNPALGRKRAANTRVSWFAVPLARLSAMSNCEASISHLHAATKFPRRLVGKHKIRLQSFAKNGLRKLCPDVVIQLKSSAIQTSLPIHTGAQRRAELPYIVATIAKVHATVAKREKAKSYT